MLEKMDLIFIDSKAVSDKGPGHSDRDCEHVAIDLIHQLFEYDPLNHI